VAEAQFAPDSFNYVNLPWCVQLGTRGGAGEHSRYLPDRRLDGMLAAAESSSKTNGLKMDIG